MKNMGKLYCVFEACEGMLQKTRCELTLNVFTRMLMHICSRGWESIQTEGTSLQVPKATKSLCSRQVHNAFCLVSIPPLLHQCDVRMTIAWRTSRRSGTSLRVHRIEAWALRDMFERGAPVGSLRHSSSLVYPGYYVGPPVTSAEFHRQASTEPITCLLHLDKRGGALQDVLLVPSSRK